MNNPEYCQGIYDAARRVVEYYMEEPKKQFNELTLDILLGQLRDALNGKGENPTQNLINQVRHLHDE